MHKVLPPCLGSLLTEAHHPNECLLSLRTSYWRTCSPSFPWLCWCRGLDCGPGLLILLHRFQQEPSVSVMTLPPAAHWKNSTSCQCGPWFWLQQLLSTWSFCTAHIGSIQSWLSQATCSTTWCLLEVLYKDECVVWFEVMCNLMLPHMYLNEVFRFLAQFQWKLYSLIISSLSGYLWLCVPR